MRIIGASFLILCNAEFDILQDGGIVIDNGTIVEVGCFEDLRIRYGHSDFIFYKNHVILPAFINAHIHFEFSKNDMNFEYGNFGKWLDSVIANRGVVLDNNIESMREAIRIQKKSGVGSVCAISSYDLDLDVLLQSQLKVIYCHEVLGISEKKFEEQAIMLSTRLEKTLKLKNPLFFPALAIHSPYSVNPKIAQYTIELALKYNLLVSTHLLESQEEFDWFTQQSGYFKQFYKKYFEIENPKPQFDISDFVSLFNDVHGLFVHCLYADAAMKQKIMKHGYIISCPRSNLLLNGKMGDNFIIATDGKSSNIDVNLLEELRYALFVNLAMHSHRDIETNARRLLKAITCNPAKALRLNNGVLESGKSADIVVFKFKNPTANNFITNFILNTKQASRLLVNGNDVL